MINLTEERGPSHDIRMGNDLVVGLMLKDTVSRGLNLDLKEP